MPADCSLSLEVYEDDRVTLAWEVSTDPAHPTPFLIDPMRYGEQQLDVAKGAASIGTVTVGVIDPATIAGDQDSGWMTARLANLAGHRCRLRRYIDAVTGWVVISDGPAGEPKLEPDYASYLWEVRDTRETERKLRAFVDTEATTSIWPAGLLAAFGTIPAVAPNVGGIMAFFPGTRRIDFGGDYWATGSGTPATDGSTIVDPEMVVTPEVEDLFQPTVTLRGDGLYQYTYDRLTVMWRETGSGDPYTVVRAPFFLNTASGNAQPFFLVRDGTLADGRTVRAVWRSATLSAYDDEWSAGLYALPIGTDLDVLVLAHGAASKVAPVHVTGVTAGQFAQNMYDGIYSPRDEAGAVVPSGIRYDAAALALMTTPVSLRLFESITDARDWMEKFFYPVIGWAPALDSDGRVSPVSQIQPADDTGLTVIDSAITEPRAAWGTGSRIINIVRFIYWRDYVPDPSLGVPKTGDGLAEKRVELEFRDEASIARHGEQLLEIDGRAFRATGTSQGQPIGDDITAETGYQLAQLRNLHVKRRYASGAPSFPVAVMRSGTPAIRAGSFVVADIPWLPDPYVTGRRGLAGMAQVMSIADLDCAWRELSIEMLPPAPAVPAAIADLAADDFSHSRIDLTWTLPEGSTGVRLYRSAVAAFVPGPGTLLATLGAVDAYEDSTVAASSTYYFQAIAFNDVGDAPSSNEATTTTPAAPAPPDLLTATRTETEDGDLCSSRIWIQRISWTSSGADDAAYQVDVYRATNAAGTDWDLLASGLTTASSFIDEHTGVTGNLTGSSDAMTFYRKYRVALVPRGGGAEVEHLDTTQDSLTVYSDPCA